MDGILLINKEIGMTSRQVVNALSKKFQIKKMGHTGTLDPFASGLMVVTINHGTKITPFMEELDKTYIAEITLGSETDTQDLTGKVIKEHAVDLPLNKEEVLSVLNSFIGDIEQIPPMYSAIKINGEELYKKARRGEDVERKSRLVHIYGINLLSITQNKLMVEVHCSKGTYIRTLGTDIGRKLGFFGHVSLLVRTKVGNFNIKDAKMIKDATLDDIISITDALKFYPSFYVVDELEKKVSNGMTVKLPNLSFPKVLLKNKSEEALGIYELRNDGFYHSLRGFK